MGHGRREVNEYMIKKRRMFQQLVSFIEEDTQDAVALITGIRKTGKTTLLLQLKDHYRHRALYVDAAKQGDTEDVVLRAFLDRDIDLILIDEISYLEDYETLCQMFFNHAVHDGRMVKVIITGSSPAHIVSLSSTKLGARAKLFRLPLLTFTEYLYFTDRISSYADYQHVTNEDFVRYLKMDGMASSTAPALAITFDENYFRAFYDEVATSNMASKLTSSLIPLEENDLTDFINILSYKLSEPVSYAKTIAPTIGGQERIHLAGQGIVAKMSAIDFSASVIQESVRAVGDMTVKSIARMLQFLIQSGLATIEYTRTSQDAPLPQPCDILHALSTANTPQDLTAVFRQISICMVSPLFYTRIGVDLLNRAGVDVSALYSGMLYGKMLELYIRGAVCLHQNKRVMSVQKLNFLDGEVDIWDKSTRILCEVTVADKRGSHVHLAKYFPETPLVRVCTSHSKDYFDERNMFHWISYAKFCCMLDTGDVQTLQATDGKKGQD